MTAEERAHSVDTEISCYELVLNRVRIIQKAITEAVAEERERCARIGDDRARKYKQNTFNRQIPRDLNEARANEAEDIAAAIRKGEGI